MKKYIIKRIAISVVTILVILLVLFVMLEFMPGSPFNDEKLSPEQKAAIFTQYGMDNPFPVRFVTYIKNMFMGDFGVSYNIQKNMSIAQMISTRLPLSARIGLQAAVLGGFIGLMLGIFAALKRNTIFDSLATVVAVLGVSLPNFVFALVLSYIFGYKLKIFPLLYTSKAEFMSTVLPTISLAMFTVASIARYTRSEMIEVMATDYILLAEAKGVPKAKLVTRHILRNALIGILTVMAPLIVNLMTGSLVVEQAFAIPGLGTLFIKAIQSNDYNVVLTIGFIYSALYIGIMLLVDILYCVIDPRVRLGKEG